jgi:hypothetical protein
MGTRHLVQIKVDNEIKLANYGQWDGYPTGQGYTIAEFLEGIKESELTTLKKHVKRLSWIDENELTSRWKECGADGSGFVSFQISDDFKEKYPENSRDTGADILFVLSLGCVDKVLDSRDFTKDTLFCEYVYTIDLDKKTVTLDDRRKKRVIRFKDFTKELMQKIEGKAC